ncbi:MAG TPA: dihydrolipoyl dehydrogenase [Verrucomicrobia bacterium]|nr:dihydrolipoyl dehydrogenase [Verrucomicrobiota bacterium]
MDYDLIVVGGGPGGYVAAERAGEHGKKVLLIEKGHLGGVCLNCGCVPSKTLLNSAKVYHYAAHGAAYGVTVEGVKFDLAKAMSRKREVLDTLRKGIAGLMKMNKVEVVQGTAKLVSNREVQVGDRRFTGENILIATGSSPARPPIPGIDNACVYDSTRLLDLEKMPERLIIVGGGVIGCEFACFFGTLGVPVSVIEMLPEICPAVDVEVAKMLRQELGKRNITFHLGARVLSIGDGEVTFATGDKQETLRAGHVLVATGRTCNVADLGLEAAGVDFDRRGIRIDDRCATNVPGVWAIGDATGRQWLAHSASRMGEVVVHNLCGRPDRMRYDAIPGVVYTTPEVATVGLTEAAAKERGIPVKTAKRPMSASGRFLAEHADGRGVCKVVVHAGTNALLGVHMIGGACSEMIYGAVVMIESEMRINEIEDLVFPHPTVSELIRETALMIH